MNRIWSRGYKQAHASLLRPSFVFDIDGVLLQSKEPLPGARETLQILQGQNTKGIKYPFMFMTNGGGYLESARAKMLSDIFQLDISPIQVQLSHTVYRQIAPEYAEKPILAIGGNPDVKAVAHNYGFKNVVTPTEIHAHYQTQFPYSVSKPPVEKPVDTSGINFQAVFVFSDSFDWQRDIQLLTDAGVSKDGRLGTFRKEDDPQIPIFFSNGDMLWTTGYEQPRYGTGAFQEAAAALYKKYTGWELQRTTFGKPTQVAYDYAKRKLAQIKLEMVDQGELSVDQQDGDIFMVGDNPVTDIMGANKAGFKSVLVQTGVYNGAENDKQNPATLFAPGVLDGVMQALALSGHSVYHKDK